MFEKEINVWNIYGVILNFKLFIKNYIFFYFIFHIRQKKKKLKLQITKFVRFFYFILITSIFILSAINQSLLMNRIISLFLLHIYSLCR